MKYFNKNVFTQLIFILASIVFASGVSANTDSNWVETILVVASDTPRDDIAEKSQKLLNASRLIQQQWAGWGRSFNLSQEVRVVYIDQPIANFQDGETRNRMLDELRSRQLIQSNVKYNVFMEGAVSPGAAAHGGGCCATYYGGVTRSLFRQLPRYYAGQQSGLNDVGVIGHELGHLFNLPHENCQGDEIDNINNLRRLGLPSGQSGSIMCNNRWPSVDTPPQWMLDRMVDANQGLDQWFAETSGGTAHQPAGELQIFPYHNAQVPRNYFNLKSKHSDLCLGITEASQDNGAALAQMNCDSEPNKEFGVVFTEGGFVLKAKHSNDCLALQNNSMAFGEGIVQATCDSSDSQKVNWGQQDTIVFNHSGLCFSIEGASSNSGAKLVQQPCDNASHKQFQRTQPSSGSTGDTETKIEAESSSLYGGSSVFNDNAASNGQGVAYLSTNGAGMSISDTPAANSIKVRYASTQSGGISIYVDGQDSGTLNFSSTDSWSGNYEESSMDLNIPANSNFEIRFENGDSALNIDWVTFFGDSSGDQPGTDTDTDTDTGGLDESDYVYIIHKATGKKVSTCGPIDTQVAMVDASATNECAQWEQVKTGNFFYLRSVGIDGYIRPRGLSNGIPIKVHPTSWTGNYTQWSTQDTGDGYFHLVNRQTQKFAFTRGDLLEQESKKWRGDWTRFTFEPVVIDGTDTGSH